MYKKDKIPKRPVGIRYPKDIIDFLLSLPKGKRSAWVVAALREAIKGAQNGR